MTDLTDPRAFKEAMRKTGKTLTELAPLLGSSPRDLRRYGSDAEGARPVPPAIASRLQRLLFGVDEIVGKGDDGKTYTVDLRFPAQITDARGRVVVWLDPPKQ